MPQAAVTGAIGAGGAVFNIASQTLGDLRGHRFLTVGDMALCPGHKKPTPSIILTGLPEFTFAGKQTAFVGSATSCGHPIASSPNSVDFQI